MGVLEIISLTFKGFNTTITLGEISCKLFLAQALSFSYCTIFIFLVAPISLQNALSIDAVYPLRRNPNDYDDDDDDD